MAKLIEVKSVSKNFIVGDSVVQALKNVNFSVEEGEYVAVLGPSGSGKSTLMNVLGCMDNVQSGEYFLAGLPIHKMSDEQLTIIRNRLIGFIFQRYHLVPTYNVLQNVMMPLLVRGAAHREAQLTALQTLMQLGMEERIYHNPHELSGGQQQRVAIARALSYAPDIILADEPTGNLDAETQNEIMQIFRELGKKGKCVILVSHSPEVASLCDEVYELKKIQRNSKKK